jgi:hypothetical protein
MDWIVNRVATEEDLLPLYKKGYFAEYDIKKAWIINESTIVIQYNFIHRNGHDGPVYNKHHDFIGYWDFKGPLGKAIKHFELMSGLEGDAKDTWSDILEFKQIVLEALNSLDIKVIGYIEKEHLPDWLRDKDRKVYKIKINDKLCYFNFKNFYNCMLYVDGYKKPGLDVDNSIYDNNACKELFNVDNDVLDKLLEKAIKHFELTKGLTDSARDTWSDILS